MESGYIPDFFIKLINYYLRNQIMDLTMMSKIELGDDVIAEIKRLKGLLNEHN